MYRFQVVCPRCNKLNDYVVQAHRIPEPKVSCGDCLMERIEVVRMKVVAVEEITEPSTKRGKANV